MRKERKWYDRETKENSGNDIRTDRRSPLGIFRYLWSVYFRKQHDELGNRHFITNAWFRAYFAVVLSDYQKRKNLCHMERTKRCDSSVMFFPAGIIVLSVCIPFCHQTFQFGNGHGTPVYRNCTSHDCYLPVGKRMPAKREGAAVLLAMGGVFLLATHGQPGDLVISSQGLFWGMIAAISLVTYNILPGDILKKWGTPVVNGFGMLIGGVVLAVVFRLWEENWNYDVYIFGALAAIILIGTLLAFCLYLQGVADLGPMKASLFGCAEPVMAAIISALWLHTTFTVVDLMGFVLIIGAVLLVSSREKESDGEQD